LVHPGRWQPLPKDQRPGNISHYSFKRNTPSRFYKSEEKPTRVRFIPCLKARVFATLRTPNVKNPSGMAISDRGSSAFYVTVANGFWLLEPREEDAKLTDLQYPAGNPNRLSGPRGIAVGLNGDVYIADSDKNCIKVIYKNGTVDTWGIEGSGPGQFSQPKGLALDLDGNVYVADSGNDRIQMFDPDGVFLGSRGNSHSLNNPEGVAVDSHYNVYVADTGNSRIRKLVLNQQRPA